MSNELTGERPPQWTKGNCPTCGARLATRQPSTEVETGAPALNEGGVSFNPTRHVEANWQADKFEYSPPSGFAAFATHPAPPSADGLMEVIEREAAMTLLANVEASSDWIDGFEHAVRRIRAALAGMEG